MKEQIVYKKIDELHLNEKNPRKNDKAVPEVMKSLQEFGFRTPLIVDNTGKIWCGNTRFKASKKLGLSEVPCIVVEDLTEEQMRKYALLDNKTNEIADWDFDLLEQELIDLDLSEYELDWGVDVSEIKKDFNHKEDQEDLFEDIEKLEKHYGVPYQGNKSRIADIIISILPNGKRLVDLFGGGGVHNSLCDVIW